MTAREPVAEIGAGIEARVRLTVLPLTFRQGADFVNQYHRHNKPPRGCKFVLGVCDELGVLRGVVMAGRPVARHYDDGLTIEVNRSCTDGCVNANSALYGAAWRVASAMGYRRLITYTQAVESGVSMRAVGAVRVRDIPPRKSWAESSVALQALRDPIGSGGVHRVLWRLGEPLDSESRYATPTRQATFRAALVNLAEPCCDLHSRRCEPPSELCCRSCSEAAHPAHDDGSTCCAPDLSTHYDAYGRELP